VQHSRPLGSPHAHRRRPQMRQQSSHARARQKASPEDERCVPPTPPHAGEGEACSPIWSSQHGCADRIRPAPAESGENPAPPSPEYAPRCARHRARDLTAPTVLTHCAPPADHMRSRVYRSLRHWALRSPKRSVSLRRAPKGTNR